MDRESECKNCYLELSTLGSKNITPARAQPTLNYQYLLYLLVIIIHLATFLHFLPVKGRKAPGSQFHPHPRIIMPHVRLRLVITPGEVRLRESAQSACCLRPPGSQRKPQNSSGKARRASSMSRCMPSCPTTHSVAARHRLEPR
jgi:hypothetical protein